jgi:hypothetical protein
MEALEKMMDYLISIEVEYIYYDNGLWVFINYWQVDEFFSFFEDLYFDDDGYQIAWKGYYLCVHISDLMEYYGLYEKYKKYFPESETYVKLILEDNMKN